jgi:release factor glutamine methyltransferase
VAEARDGLRRAGIPPSEADLDARLLAQLALGWNAEQFLGRADEPADPDFLSRYDSLVARRVDREPLAYISGQKEFWNLTFEVSSAVLIPRPESELIVEAALERCGDLSPLSIADIGTGSGCLAVTLARARPRARVLATDVSAEALGIARANAVRHSVAERVQFLQTDVLRGVYQMFDLIVSNPPYVPEPARPALQPEVRDHEPSIAIFAGDSGLSVIRQLVDQSVGRLNAGGFLIFEFGLGQSEMIEPLLAGTKGLSKVEFKADLQGIPRTAIAQRG